MGMLGFRTKQEFFDSSGFTNFNSNIMIGNATPTLSFGFTGWKRHTTNIGIPNERSRNMSLVILSQGKHGSVISSESREISEQDNTVLSDNAVKCVKEGDVIAGFAGHLSFVNPAGEIKRTEHVIRRLLQKWDGYHAFAMRFLSSVPASCEFDLVISLRDRTSYEAHALSIRNGSIAEEINSVNEECFVIIGLTNIVPIQLVHPDLDNMAISDIKKLHTDIIETAICSMNMYHSKNIVPYVSIGGETRHVFLQ